MDATHGAYDAETAVADGDALHRHRRRPVPGAARHGGGRDDHVRGHRGQRRHQRQLDRAGIAAALAATVAGLAVAIPALFGYNWLNTQIKEVNADMRVFVDEFVTRVAEHYSPMSASAEEKDVYDEINITPMLDLAYVLLVIFIIMTTASVQGIKVNLPKASETPALAKPKTKAISITADGTIYIDTYPVTFAGAREAVARSTRRTIRSCR